MLDEADRQMGDVYASPAAAERLGRVDRRPTATERVVNASTGTRACAKDGLHESDGFLRWVAKTLGGKSKDRLDVRPQVAEGYARGLIQIQLATEAPRFTFCREEQ